MAVSMLAWPVMMTTSVSGRDLLELLQHLDAGHAGHAQVEDGGVERALLQRLDRRLAVGADGDLVPQPRQLGAHELLQRASRRRRTGCAGSCATPSRPPSCRPMVRRPSRSRIAAAMLRRRILPRRRLAADGSSIMPSCGPSLLRGARASRTPSPGRAPLPRPRVGRRLRAAGGR